MSLNIKTTTKTEDAAGFIFLSILNQLKSGKQVLFFVTGGSSISVGVKVAGLFREYSEQNSSDDEIRNLTVSLTDERYGPLDHSDSNWYQLIQKGFSVPHTKLIPILTGDDNRDATAEKFNAVLSQEFDTAKENKYKIALFGIGKDGHVAGILPESVAVNSTELVCAYDTHTFSRITITPKAIEKLNEVVVWAQGTDKWNVLKDLKKNIPIIKQPAQILKKVPSLTIFTDYKINQ